MTDDYIIVTVDRDLDELRADLARGDTVVSIAGETADGRRVSFAADHRPARAILAALETGEEPVIVALEPWQIGWSTDADGMIGAGWFG